MAEKILIPLDGSQIGEAALKAVEGLISKLAPETRIEITLLQVVPLTSHYIMAGDAGVQVLYTEDEKDQTVKEAEEYLKNTGERFSQSGAVMDYKVSSGNAADEILKTAEQIDADLIAMSTHGRSGISRIALGSVTENVLRSSKRPVLVVRANR